jgi:hypothetical protein
MAPALALSEEAPVSWAHGASKLEPYSGPPRNVQYIKELKLDESCRPKKYEIRGTHANSRILILDVSILDSTGRPPYRGDIFIEGVWSFI